MEDDHCVIWVSRPRQAIEVDRGHEATFTGQECGLWLFGFYIATGMMFTNTAHLAVEAMLNERFQHWFQPAHTSLQPIIVGVIDQDAPADELLSNPVLYAPGRRGSKYTYQLFAINTIDGIWQAAV
ncbi:hypothetical protein OSTOST_07217, partial [Ostertagia ostertagi]